MSAPRERVGSTAAHRRGATARVLLRAALALACGAGPARARHATAPAPFEVGADLSSLPQVEANGGVFSDAGRTADALALLRASGFTCVRLRVWHRPADGACGLDSTLVLARRVHAAGLRLLVDLHFADTWADPAHQPTPAAWRNLGVAVLADSVEAYARAVTAALVAQGTPPVAVQLGNEIDGGLLWDVGRVGGAFDTPAQWGQLTALLAAAARGVRAGAPAARLVVHVARGGDAAGCRRFCEHLERARVDYDVIAVSFYPWWHGSLAALADNLDGLANRFGHDVIVAETAYPWTLRWFDDERNLVGDPGQLLGGYPATPAGQAAFARALRRTVENVAGGRGAGVFWWEPAWIAAPRGRSPWENCALFDSTGTLLPAARGFAAAR